MVIVSTGAWSVPHMKYMRAFNFESYTLNAQVIGFLRRIAPVTPGLVIYMAPRDFSDVYPAVYDWANTGCGDKSTRTVSDGKWQTEQNTGAMEAEVQAKSESGRENEGIVVWNPAAMVACDDSCTEVCV